MACRIPTFHRPCRSKEEHLVRSLEQRGLLFLRRSQDLEFRFRCNINDAHGRNFTVRLPLNNSLALYFCFYTVVFSFVRSVSGFLMQHQ